MIKTIIRPESRSQIYPPQMIIEYEERDAEEMNLKTETVFEDTLIFKTEYTMMTEKYWATVEVMTGFVSAIAVVIWLLRVYNWQNRNKRTSIDGTVTTSSSDGWIMLLHCVAMAVHTFVIVSFPFILSLCTFW